MHIRRSLVLVALLALPAPPPVLSQRAAAVSSPVALVIEVHGTVWADVDGRKAPARTFDWFTAGTALSTEDGSTAVVVFENGARVQLGERARIRVTANGPAQTKGLVRTLAPVPPLPRVSAVTLEGPATRINAVRVRGDAIAQLHPNDAAVLADRTQLRFEPAREFGSYAIAIEREDGTIAFETTTSAAVVDVPAQVLQPGARYYWRVAAQDPLGRVVRGSARFVTLTSEQWARREALRQHLEFSPSNLAFLTAIDRSLGLVPDVRAR